MTKPTKTLIALSIWLAALAVIEVITRLFLAHNQTFEERSVTSLQYMPSGYCRFVLKPDQQVLATDDDGRPASNKVLYTVNSQGFRERSAADAASEFRIVILGGSHVFDVKSYEWENNVSWPEVIESTLVAKGYAVKVFNLGQPGEDTNDALARVLFQLPDLKPSIVILCSEWNDLKWIANFETRPQVIEWQPMGIIPNPLMARTGFLDDYLGWSSVYRKVRDAFWRYKLDIDQGDEVVEVAAGQTSFAKVTVEGCRSGFERYRSNLHMFITAVRGLGAFPVLAIEERFLSPSNTSEEKQIIRYDYIPGKPTHEELLSLFHACDSTIQEVAAARDVKLINVNPALQGKLEYFADHIHTSPQGSRRLATEYSDVLSQVIKSFRLLPQRLAIQ